MPALMTVAEDAHEWNCDYAGPHVLEIVESEDAGHEPSAQFSARCSCGAEGPDRDDYESAYADYTAHLEP